MIIFKIIMCLLVNIFFVIFLSLFVKRSFRSMGVCKGGLRLPRILKLDILPSIFCKRIVFQVSSGENVILLFLVPLRKYFWPTPEKSIIGLSLEKKPSDAHV